MVLDQPQVQTARQCTAPVSTPAVCRHGKKRGNRHSKAAEIESAKKRRRHHDDLLDQEQLARWLAGRGLVPSNGDTAVQRMERIRERVARRRDSNGSRGSESLIR